MIDSDTLYQLMNKFLIGIFFFIRIMGVIVSAPLYSNSNIIPQVKVMLGIIIATMMTTAFWQEQPLIDFHLWNVVLLILKEFLVGIAIGFVANMTFHAARYAGGIIDFDMGYHTAMLFDRQNTTPTLVGEFYSLVTLMLFIFLNGHHFIIESLYASVRAVPLTYFAVSESTVQLIIRLATSVMIIGVKMSAPILVALFLTNLSLALLARVAPQTNIFILSFQLKVVVGLLVLFGGISLFAIVAKHSLGLMETELLEVLMSLNPAREP